MQREIIEAARSVVVQAVLELYCAAVPDKLAVADLGCSSGPNALSVVMGIVHTVEERCRQLGRTPPEFQLFLNDLPGNDFNSVFRSLQAFYEQREGQGGGADLRRCFVAGVPGSFYGRLFPSSSIHLFHSASSVHWLSQVPQKLQQHDVPSNLRSIYISKRSPPSVVDAYSLQFQKDFSDFLKCRSEEMVVGGRMVLSLFGRMSSDPMSEDYSHLDLLGQLLMDMAQEGYIMEAKVNSFHLPFYAPCAMEVETEIQREGSFSLNFLKIFEVHWDGSQDNGTHIMHKDIHSIARAQANWLRAALESILASHFGGEIIEDLFLRYSKVLEDSLSMKEPKLTSMVVSLVRKP